MTDYTPYTVAEYGPDAPGTASHFRRWFQNWEAGAEGAPGAPVIAQGWHPINSTINDTGDGKIYDFAVHGGLTAINSQYFADGYEYAFFFEGLSTSISSQALTVNLYRETSGAYAGAQTLAALNGTTTTRGWLEIKEPRKVRLGHFMTCQAASVTAANALATLAPSGFGVYHATAQKILRVQFGTGGGIATTAGKIYQYRRRLY